MKANRKFLNGDDEAVSPVIAVILMVAITVVLAATVYVWVSGFGSDSNAPAKTMSIASAGPIAKDTGNDIYWKNYTVSSAAPSLTYGDFKLTVGGTQYTWSASGCTLAASSGSANLFGACAGSTSRSDTSAVLAGDKIVVTCYLADTDCLTDKDLLITDTEANSVMASLKVR